METSPADPLTCFATATFNSWILEDGDCDESESESGGFRSDLSVIFTAGVEPGMGSVFVDRCMELGIRGNVYYAFLSKKKFNLEALFLD